MQEQFLDQQGTEALAAEFIAGLIRAPGVPGTATVVALRGDLGAGKTTFTKAAAKALGVGETVTSPTFVIEKIYALPENTGHFTHLIHIDAYRLESPDELAKLGWHQIATDPRNLILIEWPERVEELIPVRAWRVEFGHAGDALRSVVIEAPPA